MRLLYALAFVTLVACGSSAPTDAEIYFAAGLRPGVELATTPGEQTLLAQLATLEAGPYTLEGERFELGTTYEAASGRVCRRVRTTSAERLACAGRGTEAPTWTFVPDPFRNTVGEETPVPPATYETVEAP